MSHIIQLTSLFGMLTILASIVLGSDGMFNIKHTVVGQDAEVSQLITILRDSPLQEREPEKIKEAIERLGEMRATIAAEDLARLITFRVRKMKPLNIKTEADERYPAKGALILIGKPALPALLKVIENNDKEELAHQNALSAVITIFRGDLPSGVQYLKEAAAKSQSLDAIRRILDASERINKLARR